MKFRWITAVIVVMIVTGCGWQLRGYEQLKSANENSIERLHLRTTSDNRLFQASLKRQLKDLSIALDPQSAIALVLHNENTERRPLSYGSTGIPVQYQLIMTIRFDFNSVGQSQMRERNFTARRQYDFDTELVVAKNEEERQLLQEMREELASRIIAALHE